MNAPNSYVMLRVNYHKIHRAYLLLIATFFFSIFPTFNAAAQANDSSINISSSTSYLAASDSSLGSRPSETDFLPAWRWQNIELDQDSGGLLGPVKSVPNSFALILFAIANFLWQILLNLTKIGLGADFITPAAPVINAAFAQLSGRILTVLAIFLVGISIWKVLKGINKGEGIKSFVPLVVCIVWLVAMTGLASASVEATKSYDNNPGVASDSYARYVGTLPWMMLTITDGVNDVSSAALTPFNFSERLSGTAAGIKEASTPNDKLTCDAYITTIHNQYLEYVDPSGISRSNKSLSGLSRLWENTLYRSWTTAQFSTTKGSADLGARTMCHQAESVNGISSAEQAAISGIAYGAPFGKDSLFRVFGPHNNDSDRRHSITAWANCQLVNGKLSSTPEMRYTYDGNQAKHDSDCAVGSKAFSNNKDGLDAEYLGVFGEGEDAFNVEGKDAELSAARKWESAWFGGNYGERLVNSFLALAVAIGMLWSLGFISIGMLFVQFTMIILLILSPILLAMLAADIRSGQVRGLFKLLGTSVFTKVFFGLIIALLVEIATVGQAIVNFLPGGGGLFGQIMKGLMPLASMVILRKILQNFGLGDIMKPMGAVSFATTSAVKATRDKSGTAESFTNSVRNPILERKTVQSGFRKADRWGPLKENWDKKGRQSRAETIKNEKDERLSRRSDERAKRGDGHLDQLKDFANSRGWNLDKVDDTLSSFAKGSTLAGATVLSAGAAPLLTGIIAGAAGSKMYNKYNKDSKGTNLASENAIDGLPSVLVGKERTMDSVTADAKLREYKRKRARSANAGFGTQAIDQAMVTTSLDSTLENLYGVGFDGFASEREALGAQIAYAKQKGYKIEDVLVASNGLLLPKPTKNRAGLSIDQLSDWTHWLPQEDSQIKDSENQDQYMARIFATGVSRGLISKDGEKIDVWSKLGLDLNNVTDRKRVESYIQGERKDGLLSDTVFESRNSASEKIMQEAALNWMNLSRPDGERRDNEIMITMQKAIRNVRSGLNAKVRTTSLSAESLQATAKLMFDARERAIIAIDQESKSAAQLDLSKYRDKLRIEFDKLNAEIFSLTQDLVTHRTDLLVGSGQIVGIESITKEVVSALDAQMSKISDLESMRDMLLMGRGNESVLTNLMSSIEADLRRTSADLIVDAGKLGEQLSIKVKAQNIDLERMGSSVKIRTNMRSVVSAIGSERFPSVGFSNKIGVK